MDVPWALCRSSGPKSYSFGDVPRTGSSLSPPSKPLWDQGSMARKSVEVESCIPGAHSLAEAGDTDYAGRQEQAWALAGCSPCSNDSCLAKGLPACTSLKEVCTTLRVWALRLAGCSMAAQDSWVPIPRRMEEKSFQPTPRKFREEEAMPSKLSWSKLLIL